MRNARRRLAPLLAAVLVTAITACNTPARPNEPEPSSSGSAGSGQADPLAGAVIVVDPGHNGGNADHPEIANEPVDAVTKMKPCDSTGTETNDGYPEHAFNFDVGRRLTALLTARGATVVPTRTSDDGVGPCMTDRAAIANEARADAAVNIHADGAPEDLRGFHIIQPALIEGYTDEIVEPSHRLAVELRNAYATMTGMPPAGYIGEHGLNTRDDMGGLNWSKVPKVMVECGNMRNAEDAANLTDPAFRQLIAEALAHGIARFLAQEPDAAS